MKSGLKFLVFSRTFKFLVFSRTFKVFSCTFEMEEFYRSVSSQEFHLEFEKLRDQQLISLESENISDPDIHPETKLFKCLGTATFKCHHEIGPYHLKVKGEKCKPSYNQWVLMWKLMSCSDTVRAELSNILLNDLIKETKW